MLRQSMLALAVMVFASAHAQAQDVALTNTTSGRGDDPVAPAFWQIGDPPLQVPDYWVPGTTTVRTKFHPWELPTPSEGITRGKMRLYGDFEPPEAPPPLPGLNHVKPAQPCGDFDATRDRIYGDAAMIDDPGWTQPFGDQRGLRVKPDSKQIPTVSPMFDQPILKPKSIDPQPGPTFRCGTR